MPSPREIEQACKEAMDAIRRLIPPDDLKAQRRLAIAEQVIDAANMLVEDLTCLGHYERKLPRILRKIHYSKKEAARMKLVMLLKQEMNKIQLRALIATPIRKDDFKSGGTF